MPTLICPANSNTAIHPFVHLSYTHGSKVVHVNAMVRLLQNTNKNPRAGSRTHWSALTSMAVRSPKVFETATPAPLHKHSLGGCTYDMPHWGEHIVSPHDHCWYSYHDWQFDACLYVSSTVSSRSKSAARHQAQCPDTRTHTHSLCHYGIHSLPYSFNNRQTTCKTHEISSLSLIFNSLCPTSQLPCGLLYPLVTED